MKNEKGVKKPAPRKVVPKPLPTPPKPVPVVELPDPPENRWAWFGAAVAAAGLFAATAALALHTLSGIELSIFRHINSWPDGLRTLFLVGTIAPESTWMAVAAVVVTFALKLYRLAWQLAAACISGYVLGYAAKHVIARPRPAVLLPDVHVRVQESGMGFPSGHTLIITIIALILFPYLPKGWRWGVLVLIPIVALSRLYLGVHAPLDVIGGFALGLMVVAAMRLLPGRLKEILRFD